MGTMGRVNGSRPSARMVEEQRGRLKN